MKKTIYLIAIFILVLSYSCAKPDSADYVIGKNRFTVNVDGDDREYYVHVPSGYNASSQTPVVFMLHGTNGTGEEFYNDSGWKEVGEAENIITVFPSSWQYCIISGGSNVTSRKWNAQPAEWDFCVGETPRDDIKFLKAVITELNGKFNVDNHRIYLVGFSSGGSMASKCTYEMSDLLAAVVESAASLYGVPQVPLRKLPILLQRGNMDYGPGGSGPTAPMTSLPFLLTDSSTTLLQGHLYKFSKTNIYNFGLDTNFTITGDTNTVMLATFTSIIPDPLNTYSVALIKGLHHAYPDGAAASNWNWLKQYTLP